MYQYRAVLLSVYDGDTVKADIDLGFGVWLHDQTLRLNVYAPEIRGEERERGLEARGWLLRRVQPLPIPVTLHTVESPHKGKYGRWIVDRLVRDGVDLCEGLIDAGYASRE